MFSLPRVLVHTSNLAPHFNVKIVHSAYDDRKTPRSARHNSRPDMNISSMQIPDTRCLTPLSCNQKARAPQATQEPSHTGLYVCPYIATIGTATPLRQQYCSCRHHFHSVQCSLARPLLFFVFREDEVWSGFLLAGLLLSQWSSSSLLSWSSSSARMGYV